MEKLQRVGIVTGGSSGIGKAICKELAARAVYVVIADINWQAGEKLAQEIEQQGGQARFVQVNVAEATSIQTVIHNVFDEFGRLDYIFNNAGISMYGEVYQMTLEQWKRIVDINLWGVIYGTQAANPRSMRKFASGK